MPDPAAHAEVTVAFKRQQKQLNIGKLTLDAPLSQMLTNAQCTLQIENGQVGDLGKGARDGNVGNDNINHRPRFHKTEIPHGTICPKLRRK